MTAPAGPPASSFLSRGLLIWLATTGLVMGIGTLGVLSWAEQTRTLVIAHTMGVVTFSLYTLFFSIVTKDERRTAFSLDPVSDKTFNIATGVSVLTLLLATVFGPLEAFLKTTSLDVRQWLVCIGVSLSIIVVSEIRKAVRRRTTAEAIPAGRFLRRRKRLHRERRAAKGRQDPLPTGRRNHPRKGGDTPRPFEQDAGNQLERYGSRRRSPHGWPPRSEL